MGRKQKPKVKKTKTKKPTKKMLKNVLKPNATTKHLERCQEWLMAQQQEVKQYQINSIDTITDAESNFDNDQRKPTTIMDHETTKTTQKIIYKIYFLCEWDKCNEKHEEFVDFEQHISQHVSNEQTIPGQTNTNTTDHHYRCKWDLCGYKTQNILQFRVHVFYHTYHTKLKTKGEQLLLQRKMPPCSLDSRRRNFIPENLTKFTCQWIDCDWKFDKIYRYFDHVQKHCKLENNVEQKYVRNYVRRLKCGWIACGKEFSRIAPFCTHLRVHVQEKLFACPNCGSSFMSYNKFYAHFVRQSDEKPFQCAQCLRNYATEDLLCNHMFSHINCYKCTMCDMTCPSPSALAKHVRYRHITERPFACTFCSYRAVYKYDLDKHIVSIHERPIHICEEFGCDFTTESYKLMRKHDTNIHGLGPNIYCCHCCTQRFSEGRHLSRHLIRRHSFHFPPGHTRFLYRQEMDGLFRLQTMRMESLEVTQQIMLPTLPNSVELSNEKKLNVQITDIKKHDRHVSIILDITVAGNAFSSTSAEDSNDDYDDDDDDDNNELVLYKKPNFNEMPNVEASNDPESLLSEIEIGAESKDGIVIYACTNENNFNDRESSLMTECTSREISLKSIDNFSVMKRYIKGNKNNIIIEMKEVDDLGNVVNSETVNANEFWVTKSPTVKVTK